MRTLIHVHVDAIMDSTRKRRRLSSKSKLLRAKKSSSRVKARRSIDTEMGRSDDTLEQELESGGELEHGDSDEGFSDGQDGVDSGSVEGAESSLPGDVATAIADGAAVNGGVKKVKIAGLYKPPTHDELQSLKETQHLFKSNLMRLQITELLSEVKPKKGSAIVKLLEEKLHSLKEFISSLPSSQQVDLCDGLTLLSNKLCYPLNLDISGTKGKFQFMAPSAVKVVGSYLLGTTVKPHLNVDISLSIPAECLQAKDHLNYRYFHKRALYVAIVAGHLRKKKKRLGLKDVSFSLGAGNPLLPIIALELEGKGLSKYTVRIHTSIGDPNYFKMSRCAPDRNNVRPSFIESTSQQSDSLNRSDQSPPGPPTPHYNTALLTELGAKERHLKELYDAVKECPALVDAVVLAKIWVKQRSLDKGLGGFTGFHFAMLMTWLLSSKKINRLMSSYQILRVALQTISTGNWTTHGLTMATDDGDRSQPLLNSFHSFFDVVFVDSTGFLNLCAEVTTDRYEWLKHEATLALVFFDDSSINGFEALFMTQVSQLQKFDVLCHVSSGSVFEPSVIASDDSTKQAILLDGAVWPLPHLLRKVIPILHRGLEKRVKLLSILPEVDAKWAPTKPPRTLSDSHVTIGLLLDTDHTYSIVTMGPPADSPEAIEFRSFWGDKSELRRFQDGAINEAVIWEGSGQGGVAGRRLICHRIIQHLLHKHAGVPPEDVSCTVNQLDQLISLPSYTADVDSNPSKNKQGVCSTGEEANKKMMDVFTELSRDLRRLRGIPLSITSLQGASPAFRYTEVFPSLQWSGHLSSKFRTKPPPDSVQSDCYYPSCDFAAPPYVPAFEVVCQLESSGKWPDKIDAIKKIKTAFYVEMADALKGRRGVVMSPTEDYLDILYDGYVFRLRIYYPRELVALGDAASSSETQSGVASLKAEASEMKRHLDSLPVLTSTLYGLHQQYPSYGTGARLCKRWVSAHLLSNHLSDEAVDLMVAYLFVSPAPFTAPGSPLVVFLRFLSLLSSHDWATQPLVVNFNSELTSSDVAELVSKFSIMRASLPPLVLATPHDKLPAPWTTSSSPSQPVLLRLQLLARESLSLLEEKLSCPAPASPSSMDLTQVFRPPLEDYNILIHLHKRYLPLAHQAVDAMETGSTHQSHDHKGGRHFTHVPVVDFDPVQHYLRELKEAFSEFCLFFYDSYGGEFIAVVWRPQAFQPQPFKVMQAHCRVLDKEEGVSKAGASKKAGRSGAGCVLVPDVDTILADFQLMGEGLVKRVEVLSPPPSCKTVS